MSTEPSAESLPEPRALLAVQRYFAHSPFYPLPLYLFYAGFALMLLAPALWHSDYITDGPVSEAVALAFAGVFALSILLCLIPSRVVVGADGVERRWLWFRRFVPFASVTKLHIRFVIHPSLDLHDGENVFLPTPLGNRIPGPRGEGGWERSRMLFAIGEALDRATQEATARDDGVDDFLEMRNGESVADWKGRLLAEPTGYRERAIRDVDLWSAIADPLANARVRVGAALMLAHTAEEAEKKQIADIAATTASPQLRAALERVVEPVEDGLEDPLEKSE